VTARTARLATHAQLQRRSHPKGKYVTKGTISDTAGRLAVSVPEVHRAEDLSLPTSDSGRRRRPRSALLPVRPAAVVIPAKNYGVRRQVSGRATTAWSFIISLYLTPRND